MSMRFIYFILMILATVNLLIIIISGLLGENIYQKYGKQILKVFCQFLLLLIAIYVAMVISGLSS